MLKGHIHDPWHEYRTFVLTCHPCGFHTQPAPANDALQQLLAHFNQHHPHVQRLIVHWRMTGAGGWPVDMVN